MIAISSEAYEALLKARKPGESFSDVILRLVKNREGGLDLASVWRDIEGDEIERVFKGIWKKWGRRVDAED